MSAGLQLDYSWIEQNSMQDNVEQIYKKLRFLYQHKFLREGTHSSLYQAANSIKYTNYSHQKDNKHTSILTDHPRNVISLHRYQQLQKQHKQHIHVKSKTERVDRNQCQPAVHIECSYTCAPQPLSWSENTRKKYRLLKSSQSNERKYKEKKKHSLYTLQQESSSKEIMEGKAKSKVPSKKLSLIQMIEEKRLMDLRKKQSSKAQDISTQRVIDSNGSAFKKERKQGIGLHKNQKMRQYLKQNPAHLYSQRQTRLNPEGDDKDNEINPWPVHEADY